MQAQIKAWGNSQAIRLSKELLESAGMSLDDQVEVQASDGKIIISKPTRHITLRERAASYNGELIVSDEIDWGEPVGKELW